MKGILTSSQEKTMGKWLDSHINLPWGLEMFDKATFVGLIRIVDNYGVNLLDEDVKENLAILITALFDKDYDLAASTLAVIVDNKIDIKKVDDEIEAKLFEKAFDLILTVVQVILDNVFGEDEESTDDEEDSYVEA